MTGLYTTHKVSDQESIQFHSTTKLTQHQEITVNQSTLIERARAVLPAGGFGNFDPQIFIREGRGSRVWDEDGNEYVDCLIGSGPMILGHGHPEVLEAVHHQLGKGMTFFANNAHAIELAEEICRAVACAEQLRYLCTGTEANMYAIRLARAFTGKNKILKLEGGYHGMSPEAQMSLDPGPDVNRLQPVPDSAGIPASVQKEVIIAPFNDSEFAVETIAEKQDQLAAVIVEPFQRIIPPVYGFLEDLREVCTEFGIVLIFDEIVTGFRFAYGGAQEKYGVVPDLCTLGKIIGGGFPLAAVVGKAEIMAHFDKELVGKDKHLMQVGTLSGNPVATVAGLKTLEILRRQGQYDKLQKTGRKIMDLFSKFLLDTGHAYKIVGEPALFDVVFDDFYPRSYRDACSANKFLASKFNNTLRMNGVFKAPNKFYTSLALNEEDMAQIESAIETAANSISES